MKHVHFLHVYNKRMLCEHDCVKFRRCIAWYSFLENNFAEFLDEVGLKWIKISSGRWWPFVTATSAIGIHLNNVPI